MMKLVELFENVIPFPTKISNQNSKPISLADKLGSVQSDLNSYFQLEKEFMDQFKSLINDFKKVEKTTFQMSPTLMADYQSGLSWFTYLSFNLRPAILMNHEPLSPGERLAIDIVKTSSDAIIPEIKRQIQALNEFSEKCENAHTTGRSFDAIKQAKSLRREREEFLRDVYDVLNGKISY